MRSFSHVWLFDEDLNIGVFDLDRALDIMQRSHAAVGQPCIDAAVGKKTTTHVPVRCATALPSPCEAQSVPVVEVMTPIFTRSAWQHVHRRLLSNISDAFLYTADMGLDLSWCRLLAHDLRVQTPCIRLNVSLEHFDSRSIRSSLAKATLARSKPAWPPPGVDIWEVAKKFPNFFMDWRTPEGQAKLNTFGACADGTAPPLPGAIRPSSTSSLGSQLAATPAHQHGMRICSGVLPTLARVKPLAVYIAGCAYGRQPGDAASPTVAIFVAFIKRHTSPFRELWGQIVQLDEQELRATLTASVGSSPCGLHWQLNSVILRCELGAAAEEFERTDLLLQTAQAKVSVRLPLVSMPRFVTSGAKGFLCVTNVVRNPIATFHWDRLDEWRRSWAAVGFAPSVVFARDGEQCRALVSRGVALHCEARRHYEEVPHGNHSINFARDWIASEVEAIRKDFYLDQGLNAQVCLAYAQLSDAKLAAFVDLDEHVPSVSAPSLLSATRMLLRSEHLVGIRVFRTGCPLAPEPLASVEAAGGPSSSEPPVHLHGHSSEYYAAYSNHTGRFKFIVRPSRAVLAHVHFGCGNNSACLTSSAYAGRSDEWVAHLQESMPVQGVCLRHPMPWAQYRFLGWNTSRDGFDCIDSSLPAHVNDEHTRGHSHEWTPCRSW